MTIIGFCVLVHFGLFIRFYNCINNGFGESLLITGLMLLILQGVILFVGVDSCCLRRVYVNAAEKQQYPCES